MDSKDKSMYRIWNMSGTDVKKYRPSLAMFYVTLDTCDIEYYPR